jgi:regulator of sigma D
MLEDCKTAQERWGGVSQIIDRWLQERRELLTMFSELTTRETLDGRNSDDSQRVLEFCQILVDYVSTGHFEVYGQLAKEGSEFDDTEGLEVAGELYSAIDETTQYVLDFNDKYQTPDDLKTISQDLSALGTQLSTRFEAEDCMINVLHTSHRNIADAD